MQLKDLSDVLTDETIAKLAQLRRDALMMTCHARNKGYDEWVAAIPVMLDAMEVALYSVKGGCNHFENEHWDAMYRGFAAWDGNTKV